MNASQIPGPSSPTSNKINASCQHHLPHGALCKYVHNLAHLAPRVLLNPYQVGQSSGPRSNGSKQGATGTSVSSGTSSVVSKGAQQAHQHGVPSIVTPQLQRDFRSMFTSVLHEYAYWVEDAWVEGTIPPELSGTYVRNGPGMHVSNKRHSRHMFDGDGMVFSLAFNKGRAFFRNKFVRTKGFVKEQAAGRALFRGSFSRGSATGSPWFNPFDLDFKNVSNTAVMHLGGRLYSLWEVGRPYELDPCTLDTLGESDMGGQIGQRLAAHYRTITEPDGSKRTVCFGTKVSLAGISLEFYEFDQSGRVLHRTAYPLHETTFIHDMVVTEHWYILVVGPSKIDMGRFVTDYVTSRCSIAELLKYDESHPTKVLLYPRPGKQQQQQQARPKSPPPSSPWSSPSSAAAPAAPGAAVPPPAAASRASSPPPRAPVAAAAPAARSPRAMSPPAQPRASSPTPPRPHSTSASTPSQRATSPAPPTSRATSPSPPDTHTRTHTHHSSAPVSYPLVLHTVPFFSFHHVNAYEVEGGRRVVLDTVAWDTIKFDVNQHNFTPEYFEGGCRAEMYRLVLDLDSRTVDARRLLKRTLEFPVVHPSRTGRPHTHSYCAADAVNHAVSWGPAQVVLKVSTPPFKGVYTPLAAAAATDEDEPDVKTQVWAPGPRCFVGEPMFVPRPGSSQEDDGWVIVGVHNADTCKGEVHILDAKRLSAGPVASIKLPHHLPVSLHGLWTGTYLGPDPADASVPKWATPNVVRAI